MNEELKQILDTPFENLVRSEQHLIDWRKDPKGIHISKTDSWARIEWKDRGILNFKLIKKE